MAYAADCGVGSSGASLTHNSARAQLLAAALHSARLSHPAQLSLRRLALEPLDAAYVSSISTVAARLALSPPKPASSWLLKRAPAALPASRPHSRTLSALVSDAPRRLASHLACKQPTLTLRQPWVQSSQVERVPGDLLNRELHISSVKARVDATCARFGSPVMPVMHHLSAGSPNWGLKLGLRASGRTEYASGE